MDDDESEYRRGSQTVRYVLFSCPLYCELRQEIWGRERTRDQQDLRKILGAPALALKAANFHETLRVWEIRSHSTGNAITGNALGTI
jgi:hypothetical protein